MEHHAHRVCDLHQIACGAVGGAHTAIDPKFHQCHWHVLKISKHRFIIASFRHRQQENLPPFSHSRNFGQDGTDRSVGTGNLNLLASLARQTGEHAVKPFGPVADQTAHRLIGEKNNTGFIGDQHRQAERFRPAPCTAAILKLF